MATERVSRIPRQNPRRLLGVTFGFLFLWALTMGAIGCPRCLTDISQTNVRAEGGLLLGLSGLGLALGALLWEWRVRSRKPRSRTHPRADQKTSTLA
ncbi:hypothetical protein MPNT_10291 [Candidatus Methylacidithermus pantelleriae]|uniref:Uncharacterized protein n=1 Tax=Candidatus Methylacidithermus pantelleriae TaxID=2744239 RepID=A0A8J2BIR8_9BACT|nr:hypothetical protein MPNT_10291 [Candidatus Methylacidithermus pantelleriae]